MCDKQKENFVRWAAYEAIKLTNGANAAELQMLVDETNDYLQRLATQLFEMRKESDAQPESAENQLGRELPISVAV